MSENAFLVSLSFKYPRMQEDTYDSPRYDVFGPVELLYPPENWQEVARETHSDTITLSVFVRSEDEVEYAREKLSREFEKTVSKWKKRIDDWMRSVYRRDET